MSKKKTKQYVLDVPVKYGNVSIGDETASIGLTIARPTINLVAADESLTFKRLSVVAVLGDADPAQAKLFESQLEITGSADTGKLGVSSKTYTAKLSFRISTIDLATLTKFAKGSGRVQVFEVADLEKTGGIDDEHEDDEQTDE